ncbi:hypothetical protein [Cohaesibacter marisflavi]|uniref:hypothetical protein n=1 Tax=Cohaesibacter marisflavi TaxID=655353 RepID=UPI0029C6DB15|nr:hypothetical protein [Cohaesibacter marisflavi]
MTNSSLAAVAGAAAAQMGVSESTPTPPTGQPEAATAAEISAAEDRGWKMGAEAERERFMTIFTSDKISGNSARMSHAMDLATSSPDMSADKIVEMTTKHVAVDGSSNAGLSLDDRASDADPLGAAEGQPGGEVKGGIDTAAIYAKHNGSH